LTESLEACTLSVSTPQTRFTARDGLGAGDRCAQSRVSGVRRGRRSISGERAAVSREYPGHGRRGDGDGNGDSHRDDDSHRHGDTNGNGDAARCHRDRDVDGNTDRHRDADGLGDSHPDVESNADANAATDPDSEARRFL
jgi:hypothetical protein